VVPRPRLRVSPRVLRHKVSLEWRAGLQKTQPLLLGSVVNFSVFVRNGPKNRHLSPKYLQQSLIFNKRRFSPPGVLVYESHGGCAGDSANAELGSGAIAAFE